MKAIPRSISCGTLHYARSRPHSYPVHAPHEQTLPQQPSILFRYPRIQNQQQRRHESSARRHRKLLNIAPASYLGGPVTPSGSSGRSKAKKHEDLPEEDHIIFNPPPSIPNVYHTPSIFLPKEDLRRHLPIPSTPLTMSSRLSTPSRSRSSISPISASHSSLDSSMLTSPFPSNPASIPSPAHWSETQQLPPPVRTPYEKTYHLTEQEIEEMRQLRRSDETKWTRTRLAERFKCSSLFVGMVVQASEKRLRKVETEKEAVMSRWGTKRRRAREDRRRRKEGWTRDA